MHGAGTECLASSLGITPPEARHLLCTFRHAFPALTTLLDPPRSAPSQGRGTGGGGGSGASIGCAGRAGRGGNGWEKAPTTQGSAAVAMLRATAEKALYLAAAEACRAARTQLPATEHISLGSGEERTRAPPLCRVLLPTDSGVLMQVPSSSCFLTLSPRPALRPVCRALRANRSDSSEPLLPGRFHAQPPPSSAPRCRGVLRSFFRPCWAPRHRPLPTRRRRIGRLQRRRYRSHSPSAGASLTCTACRDGASRGAAQPWLATQILMITTPVTRAQQRCDELVSRICRLHSQTHIPRVRLIFSDRDWKDTVGDELGLLCWYWPENLGRAKMHVDIIVLGKAEQLACQPPQEAQSS